MAIRDAFIGVILFYPGITGMALRLFRCRQIGEHAYLIADLHLKCYDSTWWGVSAVNILVLIGFTIGVPVGLYFLLRRHRHELNAPGIKELYGAVYSPYRKDCYYYECVQLLLKAGMWMALVMFDYRSTTQLAFALTLNVVQLCLHVV